MKEIIAIIRSERTVATRRVLDDLGIESYTTLRVLGRSRQGGLRYPRRWLQRSADIRFLPKRLFEMVLEDHQVEAAVSAIIKANQTGRIGDGKIFIIPVEEAP
jgi:nitrogen regulatory protein PII